MTDASRRDSPRSAAEWFGVMHGPDADAERAAFEQWRALPSNAEAYARLEATWDESLFLANAPVGRNRDLSRARRKIPPAALLAAGIALTLLSGGLVAGQMGWLAPAENRQAAATRVAASTITAGDTMRTVGLSDGSRVTLDRGAVLRDLGGADARHFVLLRGRARFDVAHDPARPFLVDAAAGRVIAHGTVFEVGIEERAVRVVLLEGSVEVRGRDAAKPAAGRARFLAPGEQLVVAGGEVGAPSRAGPALLSWPGAMIGFDDTPLGEAVAAFNREGAAKIRLAGPAFA
ncbi:FecR family protein, partial [Sphingopyxis sp.]|uniref:FecR family protein n=1 Tax=Sphingopyxis sp. TaxID=1908224 RepID=UPI002EDA0884